TTTSMVKTLLPNGQQEPDFQRQETHSQITFNQQQSQSTYQQGFPNISHETVTEILNEAEFSKGGSKAISQTEYDNWLIKQSTEEIPEPVPKFPNKENYPGNHGFTLKIPDKPSHLVMSSSTSSGFRHMYSNNEKFLSVYVTHNAGSEAKIRVFVVFSKDSDRIHQVNPCLNDQDASHPNHMFLVKGNVEPRWDNINHPSVLVSPFKIVENINGTNGCSNYHFEIQFLCLSTCFKKRKKLTLFCQLEKNGKILGCECFDLKVSASPKRDAKLASGSIISAGKKRKNNSHNEEYPPLKKQGSSTENLDEVIEKMVRIKQHTRFYEYMESYFKSRCPEEYERCCTQYQPTP
ncbi:unnamed protein product, partial [Meganyctiphanes norvegica]